MVEMHFCPIINQKNKIFDVHFLYFSTNHKKYCHITTKKIKLSNIYEFNSHYILFLEPC